MAWTINSLGRRAAKLLPSVTLGLALIAFVIACVPGAAEALQLERGALARGEPWRVLTCHFAHFGGNHLTWNLLAWIVLGSLCESRSRRLLLTTTLTSAAVIGASVLAWRDDLAIYRGLSGIDSALFAAVVAGLLIDAIRAGHRLQAVLVAAVASGFAAKLAVEVFTDASVFVDAAQAGFTAVPFAHTLGAAVGLLAAITCHYEQSPEIRSSVPNPVRSRDSREPSPLRY